MKIKQQLPVAKPTPDFLTRAKHIEDALSGAERPEYDQLREWVHFLLAENRDLKGAVLQSANRASWLERQEYILVMKWSNGVRPIKTSLYGRERNLIAEGETFALAVTNAVQADADRLQKLVH